MKNKRILIIGGTGALGQALIRKYNGDNTIMIFSRDEHKHVDLLKKYDKLESYLGDIRDKSSVENAGSVHHIAFSVSDASQGKIRQTLIEREYNVTGIEDRSYFKAVYFHTEECLFLRLPPIRPGSLLMSLSKKGKKFMFLQNL